jgi:hypothetical protein
MVARPEGSKDRLLRSKSSTRRPGHCGAVDIRSNALIQGPFSAWPQARQKSFAKAALFLEIDSMRGSSGVFPSCEVEARASVDHRGGRASSSARSSGGDESSSRGIGDEVTGNAIAPGKAHPQASMRGSTSGTAIGKLELREHRHPEHRALFPSRGELRKISPGNAPAETSGSKESILDSAAPVAESA